MRTYNRFCNNFKFVVFIWEKVGFLVRPSRVAKFTGSDHSGSRALRPGVSEHRSLGGVSCAVRPLVLMLAQGYESVPSS